MPPGSSQAFRKSTAELNVPERTGGFAEGEGEQRMSSLEPRFSTALAQESKEVNWYGIRYNNLPTMGAVLVAAASVFHGKDKNSLLMLVIILLGFSTSLISLISMGCTCYVMRMWLKQLGTLVEEDQERPLEDQELQGHFPPWRKQPDWLHFMSVDLPAYGIPIAFLAFWSAFLWEFFSSK